MNAVSRAQTVYRMTSRTAAASSVIQAVSALFFGGMIHLAVDGAAIAFYVDLFNEIRGVYGRGRITKEAAWAYLQPNLAFILGDLVLDKLLGMLPVAGSYFCYVFSRSLTFRLGAFFGALSALGEDAPNDILLEKVSQLVQELFPREGFLFRLSDPDQDSFVALIAGLEGLDAKAAEARLATALHVLRGEYAVEEIPITADEEAEDDMPDDGEAGIGEPLPLTPFGGSPVAVVIEAAAGEPDWLCVRDDTEEDAEMVAAWRTIWRQWNTFQHGMDMAEAMPQRLTLQEQIIAARPLLLTVNDSAEREAQTATTLEATAIGDDNDESADQKSPDTDTAPQQKAVNSQKSAAAPKKKSMPTKKVVAKPKTKKAGGK